MNLRFDQKTLSNVGNVLVCCAVATLGCAGMIWINGPLPFLLGSLLAVAAYSIVVSSIWDVMPFFPVAFRQIGVAILGAMIGVRFSQTEMLDMSGLSISLMLVIPLMLAMHGAGYAVLRTLGKYDRTTAFFASLPGGLIEASVLGEKAGGDAARISLQHLVRIMLVVLTVPIFLSYMSGESLRVAQAINEPSDTFKMLDLLLLIGVAFGGMSAARYLRLPSAHLLGPVAVGVLFSLCGNVQIDPPAWLIAGAQIVVGVSLGVRYAGTSANALVSGLINGLCVVGVTLPLAFFAAWCIHPFSPASFEALVLCFAPGGVAELSVIALSLGLSPVLVALHHLTRIGGALGWAVFVGWTGRVTS